MVLSSDILDYMPIFPTIFLVSIFRIVNTLAKEQLKPEFLAINPQHTIPTLVDDGQSIWDSHAINAYLVTKYAKDDTLYPKEAYARAVVDQRLHFDNGTLFARLGALVRPVFVGTATEWDAEALEKFTEALEFAEIFLASNQYIAGNQLTIADFSCLTTISTILILDVFEESRFPKVCAWVKRLQQLEYYQEANGTALETVKRMFNEKLAANKAAATASQ
jgi:glutathione S-transferase